MDREGIIDTFINFSEGLYSKPEYADFLSKKHKPSPCWCILSKGNNILGHAIFTTGMFYWRIVFGRKYLFSFRITSTILRNRFLNLSEKVFFNLYPKRILDLHKTNLLVMYNIPCIYLSDLKRLKCIDGTIRYLPRKPYKHYFINLDGSFENYILDFKSKGKKLKRKKQRFEKNCANKIRFKAYEDSCDVSEFLHCSLNISRNTYQHKLLRAGLNSSQDFIDYVHFLSENGYLKSFILFDGNIPVSYIFGSLIDGYFTPYKTGYDPNYAKLSPGTILWFHVIETLFNDKKAKIFDFTEGEDRFKEYFARKDIQCVNVCYFRTAPHTYAVIFFDFLFAEFTNVIRQLKENIGCGKKTKKSFLEILKAKIW